MQKTTPNTNLANASSASRTHTNFQRLLQRCESSPTLESDAQKKQFGSYIETLENQLADLKAHQSANGITTDQWNDYNKRLYSLKTRDKGGSPSDLQLLLGSEKSLTGDEVTSIAATSMRKRFKIMDLESIESMDDAAFEKFMDQNRHAQDSYSQEMVKLAKALKDSHMAVTTVLQADNKVLDSLSNLVDQNLTNTEKENEKLKQTIGKSTSFTLLLWVMMVLVAITFVGTYIFMKIVPRPS
eukprot:TRINITY_DN9073_c0_g1_i1.p1 TRINITY_DN9073_c0_g1~~TRINITY_DN9073_c0_g1_i1.p1  ORF type:complete len:242 (-),score=50.36 TRINITY_DN9073_c0_g1_i1:39-764(-)